MRYPDMLVYAVDNNVIGVMSMADSKCIVLAYS